jgi:inosine-uridine nucleoside N-ribohydrolase
MTERFPLVLDCDPGHDDALALVLALARPEVDLLAVTTVAGNAGLRETTLNARRVLALVGRDGIPVAAGAAGPLVRPLHVADDVHGKSGLEGADLPEPTVPARPEGAIELLRAVLSAAPEPVHLAAVGPLTNVALFVRTHPELVERLASIRIMGGAITEGNTTASAEFNIWQDPEAARIVLDCGRPITLMTLDVTHQALFREADVVRLEALGTRPARVFAGLLRFFARFHAERYGWDGSPIHDAVAVGHLALPELVETRPYRVDVETASELTRGRTVGDGR